MVPSQSAEAPCINADARPIGRPTLIFIDVLRWAGRSSHAREML